MFKTTQLLSNSSNDTIFMNIDVKPNMCQDIYFNNKNEATFCKHRAKYLKNKIFHLCDKHKNQKIFN